MSQRLTISIPDQLHEQLEAVKGKGHSIVVSNICARALEEEVAAIQRRSEGTVPMGAVERLRAERKKLHESVRNAGYERGWKWVMERATYEELVELDMILSPDFVEEESEDRFLCSDSYAWCYFKQRGCDSEEYLVDSKDVDSMFLYLVQESVPDTVKRHWSVEKKNNASPLFSEAYDGVKEGMKSAWESIKADVER